MIAVPAVVELKVTVVTSASSTTVLTTVPVLPTDSKLLPVVLPMLTDRLSVPLSTASSARTVYTAVPVLEPTGIVIVWLLLSVITRALPATWAPTVAV